MAKDREDGYVINVKSCMEEEKDKELTPCIEEEKDKEDKKSTPCMEEEKDKEDKKLTLCMEKGKDDGKRKVPSCMDDEKENANPCKLAETPSSSHAPSQVKRKCLKFKSELEEI